MDFSGLQAYHAMHMHVMMCGRRHASARHSHNCYRRTKHVHPKYPHATSLTHTHMCSTVWSVTLEPEGFWVQSDLEPDGPSEFWFRIERERDERGMIIFIRPTAEQRRARRRDPSCGPPVALALLLREKPARNASIARAGRVAPRQAATPRRLSSCIGGSAKEPQMGAA